MFPLLVKCTVISETVGRKEEFSSFFFFLWGSSWRVCLCMIYETSGCFFFGFEVI